MLTPSTVANANAINRKLQLMVQELEQSVQTQNHR